MSDASMVDLETTVTRGRHGVTVVESVCDAARTTQGTASITVRLACMRKATVCTLTITRGPLAAPGATEKVVFVIKPGDLDSLATTIRAAVDAAHHQDIS